VEGQHYQPAYTVLLMFLETYTNLEMIEGVLPPEL
jgi:hypothetical protein